MGLGEGEEEEEEYYETTMEEDGRRKKRELQCRNNGKRLYLLLSRQIGHRQTDATVGHTGLQTIQFHLSTTKYTRHKTHSYHNTYPNAHTCT